MAVMDVWHEYMKYKLWISMSFIVILVGCSNVPFKEIEKFSNTAQSVSTGARSAIVRIDESDMNYQFSRMASKSKERFNGVGLGDFQNIKGIFGTNIDKNLVVKGTEILSDYAKSLGDLAAANTQSDIDKSSAEVYEALQHSQKTYEKITDKPLNINNHDFSVLAAAISGLGQITVNIKKEKAIKHVVAVTNKPISTLCTAMAEEMDRDRSLAITMMKADFASRLASLKQDYEKLSIDEREQKIRTLHTQALNIENVSNNYTKLSKAILTLKDTHNAMNNALQKRASFADFKQNLRELNGIYKDVKALSQQFVVVN